MYQSKIIMSLLFYTAADKKYEILAPLYIYFALRNNPQAKVEIGLSDVKTFTTKYNTAIEILTEEFGDRFKFTEVDFDGVSPGVVRFITEPDLYQESDYVYIGDIDILILESEVKESHLKNMSEKNTNFSNIIRDTDADGDPRLTGLHFAPTDVQYPLPDLSDIDYSYRNSVTGADEAALYKIMDRQTEMISQKMDYRPEHGIHVRMGHHPFGKGLDGSAPEFSFKRISNGECRYPWSGIEIKRYRRRFLEILEEEPFQELYFNVDIRARNLIIILENICHERFEEFEWESYTHIIAESRKKELIRKSRRYMRDEGAMATFINRVLPHLGRLVKEKRSS